MKLKEVSGPQIYVDSWDWDPYIELTSKFDQSDGQSDNNEDISSGQIGSFYTL